VRKEGSTYKSQVTTSEGTRTFERLPFVLECNIKVDLMEIGRLGVLD